MSHMPGTLWTNLIETEEPVVPKRTGALVGSIVKFHCSMPSCMKRELVKAVATECSQVVPIDVVRMIRRGKALVSGDGRLEVEERISNGLVSDASSAARG